MKMYVILLVALISAQTSFAPVQIYNPEQNITYTVKTIESIWGAVHFSDDLKRVKLAVREGDLKDFGYTLPEFVQLVSDPARKIKLHMSPGTYRLGKIDFEL